MLKVAQPVMKQLINQRTTFTVSFYVLVVILMILAKPSFMFEEDGRIRQFGVGDGKTIVSLGVIVVVFSIISFYIFACIDVIFSKRPCSS